MEGKLATQGVYGLIRHPQYTGIMLAVFGQVIHWPTVITLLFPLIVLVYVRLAKREESALPSALVRSIRPIGSGCPCCSHVCGIGGSSSIHCSLLIRSSLMQPSLSGDHIIAKRFTRTI
ncbi:isoprenylcysteine carboxylmethyltransferase family protein [Pseudomonas sp. H3(2019)]|uniref:methyltransferase family protein n=1 Tax=Pseudomonas sp. H3(2019) TaxID=2598724 RepID=UPI0027402ABF|nr:methyltransferase [Pseudomonas sp. H3(2019)]